MQRVSRPVWKDVSVPTFDKWRVIRGDRVEVVRGKSKVDFSSFFGCDVTLLNRGDVWGECA